MRKKLSFSQFFLILLALLVLFFFVGRSSWWFGVKSWLFNPRPEEDLVSLKLENQNLKSQIIQLQNLKIFLSPASNYLPAFIFSSYPFNFKNELVLSAGGREGVKLGAPVVLSGVFLGEIKEVFQDTSLAETLFDPAFQMSARIGKEGVNTLIQGGEAPKATLIDKNSPIQKGDIVYSADKRFPFGLGVAEIDALSLSENKIFEEATLKFDYNLTDLKTVFVITSSGAFK